MRTYGNYKGINLFSPTFVNDVEKIYQDQPHANIETSYVYIAAAGEFIKIGTTSMHPEKRLNVLQSGCPFEMQLLCYFLGNFDLESLLHTRFASYKSRESSEWYANDGDLKKFITSVIKQTDGKRQALATSSARDISDFSGIPEKPFNVDLYTVASCKSFKEACIMAWAFRVVKNMTRTTLSELGGFYRAHVSDWLSDNGNNRDMPAKHIKTFESIVGNTLPSQWLALQSGLLKLDEVEPTRRAA